MGIKIESAANDQWPMVRLGDVCTVVSGGTPKTGNSEYWNGEIPWVTPKDLVGKKLSSISRGSRNISKDGLKNCSAELVPEGSVLLSSRAPIGLVAIAKNPLATNQGFKNLIPKEQVFSPYLAHYLSSIENHLKNLGTGATFKELSKSKVEEIKIPLPPIEEQRKIASIFHFAQLSAEKSLKSEQARIHSLNQLAEHITSKATGFMQLDDFANIQGGLSLSKKRQANPIAVDYLRVANVHRNKFNISEVKKIQCTPREVQRTTVTNGDILLIEAHANRNEVGRACLVKGIRNTTTFQNHLFRVRTQGTIPPAYLTFALNSNYVRKQLLRITTTTSGLNTTSISKIRKLRIPIPEESEIERFETLAERLECQSLLAQKRNSLYEELSRTLANRMFSIARK